MTNDRGRLSRRDFLKQGAAAREHDPDVFQKQIVSSLKSTGMK